MFIVHYILLLYHIYLFDSLRRYSYRFVSYNIFLSGGRKSIPPKVSSPDITFNLFELSKANSGNFSSNKCKK